MFWTNDTERARGCRAVLAVSGQERLFTPDGPVDELLDVTQGKGGVSPGLRIMCQVAMDLWNGGGGASFRDFDRLDHRNKTVIGRVLVALGHEDPHAVPELLDQLEAEDAAHRADQARIWALREPERGLAMASLIER